MNRTLLLRLFVSVVIGLGLLFYAGLFVNALFEARGRDTLEGRTKAIDRAAEPRGRGRAKEIEIFRVSTENIGGKKRISVTWRNNSEGPISYVEARLWPASAKDKAELVAIYDGPPIAPGAVCQRGSLLVLPFEKLPSDSVQVEVDGAFRADEVKD